MIFTIDEWKESGCFTPLMNVEKRDAFTPLINWRNGMLYTIGKWRETGCFTPLMNGEKRDA